MEEKYTPSATEAIRRESVQGLSETEAKKRYPTMAKMCSLLQKARQH